MIQYENPRDKRIYDIEIIKEWARQDVISEIAEREKKKKALLESRYKLFSMILLTGFAVYCVWLMSDFLF